MRIFAVLPAQTAAQRHEGGGEVVQHGPHEGVRRLAHVHVEPAVVQDELGQNPSHSDHPPPLDKDGNVQLTEAEIVQRLRTLQAPLRTGDFSKLCAERENRPRAPLPRPATPSAV